MVQKYIYSSKIERELIKTYEPEWNSTSGKYINFVEKNLVNKGRKEVKNVGNISKYYSLEKYLDRQKITRLS